MLQFIMEQNLLLYVCGVACALGVVSQFLLKHHYEKLINETQGTREGKSRFVQQVRLRFQNCAHLNETVKDISAFANRSILDYRYWKLNLHQWGRMGLGALTVCLLSSGAGLWLLYRNGEKISLSTSYSMAGFWSLLLIGLAYGLADNRYHLRSLQVRLMDYLENSGAVRSYTDAAFQTEEASEDMEGTGMRPAPAGDSIPAAGGVNHSSRLELGQKEVAASSSAGGLKLSKRMRATSKEEQAETRAQREKRELKENLRKVNGGVLETAASRETAVQRENGSEETGREKGRALLQQMDPREKEQLLRDVLMEFLT